MFSRYGTHRGCEQRTGMGNLVGCVENVGYRVKRCVYYQHQMQSAEPLRMPQPNFDEEKREVLSPSARGSFHDSAI